MSSILRKLSKNINHESDSNDENDPQMSDSAKLNDENKEPPTMRKAIRGRAVRIELSDDDDNSDEDCGKMFKPKFSTQTKSIGGGIYSMKINQTKKEIKNIHHTFESVDKKIVTEKEEEIRKKKSAKKEADGSSSNNESLGTLDSDDTDSSTEIDTDNKCSFKNIKKKKLEKKEEVDSPISLSPPPPPSLVPTTRPKRKSNSAFEKQLKELEKLKQNSKTNDSLFNDSDNKIVNIDEIEEDDEINVRVLTKNGVQRFKIKQTQPFRIVYERLAKLEETQIECLVLMHNSKKINYNDTPKSLNLKILDIIECGRVAAVFKESIQIINNDDDEEPDNLEPNELTVILQTQEGRKSRLRFLIRKSEKMSNVLKKYCEKKSLDAKLFMLEFDGERVDVDETPEDLDLDGGEMFEVKKNSKATADIIKENNKKYEFDDDVLIA